MSSTVKEQDLLQVLAWLKDLRLRALKKRIDPWATRQALVMILVLDKAAALERGVTMEALHDFDEVIRADSRKWVRRRG